MNILASVPYVGTTGYNSHTRNFLRRLSLFHNIKVRNFTIGKDWKGYHPTENIHGNDVDKFDQSLLALQSLWDNGQLKDFPIYGFDINNFAPDIHLVLSEVNHHYFYSDYNGPKIAYTVWESTLYPQEFFNKLQEFDQVWVPSQWQAEITINQGIDAEKVKVVREGVDTNIYYPENLKYDDDKFRFLIFGRWDDRKSIRECIQAFKNVFGGHDKIELIISVDNPFSVDNLKTTEERLEHYNLKSSNIKVLHFPSNSEYISYLKKGNVFLSCARSEGWNLPLIEAMACGTPSIYSDCSAQLEFASGKGIPVKIKGEIPIKEILNSYASKTDGGNHLQGNWYEPDFKDLEQKILYAYENYNQLKEQAIIDSEDIRENFTWQKSAISAANLIGELAASLKGRAPKNKNTITCDFNDGVKVEILGSTYADYEVIFCDDDSGEILYSSHIKNNMWAKCNIDYHVNWKVDVISGGILVKTFKLDLNGKRVKIINDSGSIGDILAWIPAVEAFTKKYNCTTHFYSPHRHLFESEYPSINFFEYHEKENDKSYYKTYKIGCFKVRGKNWNQYSLQDLASQTLGVELIERKPRIAKPKLKNRIKKKYVCIAIQSTAQFKYWNNPTGWQQTVDYLKGLGYEVVCIDRHPVFGSKENYNEMPKNCIDKTGDYSLFNRINDLSFCEFFIGLSSGLSWLAWALDKDVILISGIGQDYTEFKNPFRVSNKNVCNGCSTEEDFVFDRGNWMFCPKNKNFECTREISFEMVKEKIDKCIEKIDK